MDERYLVARVRSRGLVVLTGCSHAGVINVCQDVKHAFANGGDGDAAAVEEVVVENETSQAKKDDIFFVVGGFHLAGPSMETRIEGSVIANPAPPGASVCLASLP